MLYDFPYRWDLKSNGTNEFTYMTEVEAQMQKTHLWLPGDKGRGGIN